MYVFDLGKSHLQQMKYSIETNFILLIIKIFLIPFLYS